MKTNRKRNVSRKSKQARTVPNSTPEARSPTTEAGYPVAAGDFFPAGFVSQNAGPAVSTLPDSKPEARSRTTEAGYPVAAGDSPAGFVSQTTGEAVSLAPDSTPEAGSRITEAGYPVAAGDFFPAGFVSQTTGAAASAVPDSSPEAAVQRAAINRANAQHSTGPRTLEGKAASAQNAFKHGLSIHRHAILPTEDPDAYAQILDELRDIYEPRSRREDLAVEDIAQCRWALQRFDEADAVALEKETRWCTEDPEKPTSVGEALGHCATTLIDFNRMDRDVIKPDIVFPTFDKIHRYRTWWDRRLERALTEFDRAQRSRRQEASQSRAEAQAARQAEAHAQKLELAANRDRRQQELHELRLALAREKLTTEQAKQAHAQAEAGLRHLEAFVNAPGPVTEEEFLSEHGFVSQNAATAANTVTDSSPEPGSRTTDPSAGEVRAPGFVSQSVAKTVRSSLAAA